MRSSDWSSDVCSSDLSAGAARGDSPWAGPCRPAEPGRAKLAAGRSHDRAGEAGRQKRGSRDCGDGGSRRQRDMVRSAERRVVKECVSTCSSRGARYPIQKTLEKITNSQKSKKK